MTASYTQQVTRFSKINHAYFFIEAARRKDYLQVCRHFLWQLNRGNNQPLTQTSIVSTIAELTKHFIFSWFLGFPAFDRIRPRATLEQGGASA
jgi:hypothetical protein